MNMLFNSIRKLLIDPTDDGIADETQHTYKNEEESEEEWRIAR